MFFLARSAICIGLVASLLPATGGAPPWTDLAERAEAAASNPLQSLCAGPSHRCDEARIAQLVLASAIGTGFPTANRKSTDTLLPSDVIAPWNGPAARP